MRVLRDRDAHRDAHAADTQGDDVEIPVAARASAARCEYTRSRAADASSAAPARIRRAATGQPSDVRRERTIAPTTPEPATSGAAIVCFSPYASWTRLAIRSAIAAAGR